MADERIRYLAKPTSMGGAQIAQRNGGFAQVGRASEALDLPPRRIEAWARVIIRPEKRLLAGGEVSAQPRLFVKRQTI